MKIRGIIILIIITILPTFVHAKKDPADLYKTEAITWIDNNGKTFDDVALTIHEYAETALKEYKSAALLADILEKEGFTVERGVAGMPTAFVASFGSGSPVIGILAEYDALPGLSQKEGSTVKDAKMEGASGHGCGHNLLGVASVEAAIAVSKTIRNNGLKGTIKLFGCPAEETVTGKVYMARDGVFNGLDACLCWHPSGENTAGYRSSLALNNFEIIFHGKTSHAAANPVSGRSALDAVEIMDTGVNFLREHIGEKARVHYIIKNGGMAPNIVPDYASVWYFVRDIDRDSVDKIYSRVLKCAEGAALMTETTFEVKFITGAYNYLPNKTITEVVQKNLNKIGVISYSNDEQIYAKTIQKNMGINEKGYSTIIVPLPETLTVSSASTDVSDVSWNVPTSGELGIAVVPESIPGHSWGIVSCSSTSAAMKGLDIAAKVLSTSAIDLFLDKKTLDKARAEFNEQTKGKQYKSPLPEGQVIEIPPKEK